MKVLHLEYTFMFLSFFVLCITCIFFAVSAKPCWLALLEYLAPISKSLCPVPGASRTAILPGLVTETSWAPSQVGGVFYVRIGTSLVAESSGGNRNTVAVSYSPKGNCRSRQAQAISSKKIDTDLQSAHPICSPALGMTFVFSR